jgi:glutaryl-CoA dehydrogenase
MGALGLLGATLPTEYGGAGLNYVCYGLIAREVERVDSGYRSMMSVQSSLVMFPIFTYGSEAQRKEISAEARCRRMDRLLRADRTQPRLRPGLHDHARPRRARGLSPRRQQDVDLELAHRRRVRRLGEDGRRRDRGFILEKGMRGLSAPKIEGKFSLRTSVTGEIVMDDVPVPADHLLPNVKGLAGPFGCLNSARYGIAWGALGAAEACWHAARQYTLDRKQFGRPLAANQLIQKKLADMQTEITLGPAGLPAPRPDEGRRQRRRRRSRRS